VERLEAAGGVFIGKTNCDEFAMGSSNENSAFGPVRNPVAPGPRAGRVERRLGGGGGAGHGGGFAGLRYRRLHPAAASFCGVVGVTPTYGRVSRYGLVAFASSLDHIGPFARNVATPPSAGAIAGRDPPTPPRVRPRTRLPALLDGNVKGMKIGLPREYLKDLSSETGDLIRRAWMC
jgi:aspartyl-tRNA(Asn)/glutamyl-tRNA(Gln) amidotransferase subunit A